MVILGLDTSSALTSVAVVDGDSVLAERSELDPRRHAEVMAPLVREAMAAADVAPNDVEAIACGVGPGAYTGLRVAIATARALGLVWERPVYGLCSLDAVALQAFAATELDDLCVAVDARRREVYWAAYSREGGRLTGPWVMRPAEIDEMYRVRPWVMATDQPTDLPVALELHPTGVWVGRAVGRLLVSGATMSAPALVLSEHGSDGAGTAEALLGLGLLPPEPLYMRRPDAAVPVVRP